MTNTKPMDRKVLLSTLWIFAMFNYLYADVYTLFFNPILQRESWQKFVEGFAGSIPITQGFVLITAVLMETAIAMVILSRVLKHRANRWVNIASGAFHTAVRCLVADRDPANCLLSLLRDHRNGVHPSHRLAGNQVETDG